MSSRGTQEGGRAEFRQDEPARAQMLRQAGRPHFGLGSQAEQRPTWLLAAGSSPRKADTSEPEFSPEVVGLQPSLGYSPKEHL